MQSDETPEPSGDPGHEPAGDRTYQPARLPPLHWGVRLAALVIGGVLMVIGFAGLVLPGIQGILTIALGLAVLSLASEAAHRALHRLLGRWPSASRRMERLRERIHDRLSPRGRTEDSEPPD